MATIATFMSWFTIARGVYVNGVLTWSFNSEIDPVYDSDDSDAQGPVNTIGNIPLSFYDRCDLYAVLEANIEDNVLTCLATPISDTI